MTYEDFLTRIIDDGIEAARRDYGNDPAKRRGAIAGFEACRDKNPVELAVLLRETRLAGHEVSREAMARSPAAEKAELDEFWEARCYQAEVEWVCNCVSAMLMNEGRPVIVQPTARGVLRAAEVLGSKPGPRAPSSYEIGFNGDDKWIKCLLCGAQSYAPGDIENLYCGKCRTFHVSH